MIRFTRTDLTFLHKTLFAKKRNSAKIVTAAIMASNLTTSTHHQLPTLLFSLLKQVLLLLDLKVNGEEFLLECINSSDWICL
jgi:hypothetical protein